ncbi:hypothetical protein Desaci_0595 [Desulfosporosinus acidiphilus SJ4]|uniref:DUF6385 domain-containing protein n=1 Tax=Desulfosporosinus acidiphilus (strain DSM 22704 / JCM 16185 / SJ4) TaxID=646529 RepID=I4D1I3_DESAJ|nr:DUF6385 domain-containing protein [Desulfosporosinus acidiphilus]AFM39657.1 hypothetical protein Desaci_0595 [Desulfosporosinus acidiphilus SJ4]
MALVNQVYNSHFLLGQENRPDFPDGWVQAGGDSATTWEWLGSPQGSRAVEIIHPSGPRAGISLGNDVLVPAGESQRWELKVVLQAEPSGIPCYIRIYLGAVSQLQFAVRPESEPESFTRVFATPVGVTALRIEVGILGAGSLTIHEVQAWRLYPERELRLDDKGQVYVRHIDSLGKIQTPVSVNVINKTPLPVDIRTPIKTELRNLMPSRDGVKIFSSEGAPIISKPDGSLPVTVSGRKFLQRVEMVSSRDMGSTVTNDVSEATVYSYAIYNMGIEESLVQLQISPDGVIWTADDVDREVLPGDLIVITPNYFLRYIRLAYQAQIPGSMISLMIWFQSQN